MLRLCACCSHPWLFVLCGDQLTDAAVHSLVAARMSGPAPEHVCAGAVFVFPAIHTQTAHTGLPGRPRSVCGRAPPFLLFRSLVERGLFSFVGNVARVL